MSYTPSQSILILLLRDLFDMHKYLIVESSTYHCSPQNKLSLFFFLLFLLPLPAFPIMKLTVWGEYTHSASGMYGIQCTIVAKNGDSSRLAGFISHLCHLSYLEPWTHQIRYLEQFLPNSSGSQVFSSKNEDYYINKYMRIT